MNLPDKLVLFGQSCVGKTTFAQSLNRKYHCFDGYFPWHLIETCDLSITAGLEAVQQACNEDSYVLDGWHLSDPQGEYLPVGATVAVIFASYARIVDQYRIPVIDRDEFFPMYRRWYGLDYSSFANTIYIENAGDFIQRSEQDYSKFVEAQFAAHQADSCRPRSP